LDAELINSRSVASRSTNATLIQSLVGKF